MHALATFILPIISLANPQDTGQAQEGSASVDVLAIIAGEEERATHDWAQWNGPGFDGVSSESNWSSEGAAESLWEAELGLGYSTVSVVDGRLFTMGYDDAAGLDTVYCLDALSGKALWSHSFSATIWDLAHEGGTVNTPSVDGDAVIALNREGNLFSFDAATGKVRWHRFLMAMGNKHELEYPKWGFSASPMVLEDGLFLNCGKILSIERKTGKILWASEDFGHAYGTPLAFVKDGVPSLAVLNARGIGVIDRRTGETVAFREFSGKQLGINASTPVLMGEELFIASGTIPACGLFQLGKDGIEAVWENREMVTRFSGCVAMNEHLYGFDGEVLKCIDAQGKAQWSERGIGNGAVTGAGDRLLVMGANGELQVVKASPAGYEVLSKVALWEADSAKFWTKPILVNGIIYCRSNKGQLIARDHRM